MAVSWKDGKGGRRRWRVNSWQPRLRNALYEIVSDEDFRQMVERDREKDKDRQRQNADGLGTPYAHFR
jgi:hypothetical protein